MTFNNRMSGVLSRLVWILPLMVVVALSLLLNPVQGEGPPKTTSGNPGTPLDAANDDETPSVLLRVTEKLKQTRDEKVVGEIIVHDDETYRWTVHRIVHIDRPLKAEYAGTVPKAILRSIRAAIMVEAPELRPKDGQPTYEVFIEDFKKRHPPALDNLRAFLEESHLPYHAFAIRCPKLRIAKKDGSFRAHSVIGRRRELSVATWAHAIAVSPNGKMLALVGTDDVKHEGSESISLWDVEAEKEVAVVRGSGAGSLRSVAWSPDGTRLATGAENGVVSIWELQRKERVPRRTAKLEGHAGAIAAIRFSPDKKILATSNKKGSVMLWDLESGQRRAEIKVPDASVVAFSFINDGKHLLSAVDSRGLVRLIHIGAGRVSEGPFDLKVKETYSAATVPLHKYWAAGSRFVKVSRLFFAPTEICHFDAFPKIFPDAGPEARSASEATDMAFSPGHLHLAIVTARTTQGVRPTASGNVIFLNYVTGKVIGYLDADNERLLMHLAYLPDGRMITINWTGVATIWSLADLTSGLGDLKPPRVEVAEIKSGSNEHGKYIAVTFAISNPNGDWLSYLGWPSTPSPRMMIKRPVKWQSDSFIECPTGMGALEFAPKTRITHSYAIPDDKAPDWEAIKLGFTWAIREEKNVARAAPLPWRTTWSRVVTRQEIEKAIAKSDEPDPEK
jgi:hypothetical protein